MGRIRQKLPERLDVPEVRALVEEATKLYESKKYDKAELVLAKAEIPLAQVRKGRQRIWWERELEMWRARIAHKRGKHDQAAEMFTGLLRDLPSDDSRHWSCLEWLGHDDWFCERYDAAYKAMVRVAAGAPDPVSRARARADLPKIRHHRAIAWGKEGRIADAMRELNVLLAEKPDEPLRSQLFLSLGRTYALPDVKRYSEARDLLGSAMASLADAKDRESAKVWWQFARCQMAGLEVEAGKYDVALQQLDVLLEEGVEGRGRHGVLMWKASALRRSGEYRAAERCWIEVLRSDDVEPKMRADATEYLEKLRSEHLR